MTAQRGTIEQVIGARLRKLREQNGLKLHEAGKLMEDWLGASWSRQQMHAAEQGDRQLRVVELIALAMNYGVSFVALVSPLGVVDEITMPSGERLSPQALTWLGIDRPDAMDPELLEMVSQRMVAAASETNESLNEIYASAQEIDALAKTLRAKGRNE